MDADKQIRRTYNCTFIIQEDNTTFQIGRDKNVWFDKFIRPSIGIYHVRLKEYRWFNRGLYPIETASYTFDATTSTITLSCLDMVSLLNGMLGGQVYSSPIYIPATIKNDNGISIANIVRNVLIDHIKQYGKIKEYYIEDIAGYFLTEYGYESTNIIPDPDGIVLNAGSTVWDVIEALVKTYPGYQTYFDEHVLIVEPIPTYGNDPVMFDAEQIASFLISENTTLDFGTVKNVTVILGQQIESNYFAENVTVNGSNIILWYDSGTELKAGYNYGFTAIADSLSNPCVKVYIGNSLVGTHFIMGEDNSILPSGKLKKDKSYVMRFTNNNMYYMGEMQIVGIAKLVSRDPKTIPSPNPTLSLYEYDKVNEITTNISYIVDPESPFCLDYEIGEKRQILSGGDYDMINLEIEAIQRAEYENWKSTDLLDTLTLEMIDIPFLLENTKIEYYSNSLGKKQIYLVKSKVGSSTGGTMTVTCVKFKPLYPWYREVKPMVTHTKATFVYIFKCRQNGVILKEIKIVDTDCGLSPSSIPASLSDDIYNYKYVAYEVAYKNIIYTVGKPTTSILYDKSRVGGETYTFHLYYEPIVDRLRVRYIDANNNTLLDLDTLVYYGNNNYTTPLKVNHMKQIGVSGTANNDNEWISPLLSRINYDIIPRLILDENTAYKNPTTTGPNPYIPRETGDEPLLTIRYTKEIVNPSLRVTFTGTACDWQHGYRGVFVDENNLIVATISSQSGALTYNVNSATFTGVKITQSSLSFGVEVDIQNPSRLPKQYNLYLWNVENGKGGSSPHNCKGFTLSYNNAIHTDAVEYHNRDYLYDTRALPSVGSTMNVSGLDSVLHIDTSQNTFSDCFDILLRPSLF